MTLDQSAPLEVLDALKVADVGDRNRLEQLVVPVSTKSSARTIAVVTRQSRDVLLDPVGR